MKKNKLKVIIPIIIIGILIIWGYFFINGESTRLSPEERAWLTNSSSKIQNISIINDENIFGKNGKGVFFDYLKDFQDNYGIALNTITFKSNEKASGAVMMSGTSLPENSLNIYEDHFILASKQNENIIDFNKINNKKIGVLSTTKEHINTYINNELMTYTSKSELITSLEDGIIDLILVPRMSFIDIILERNYYINYHFSDIPYYYYANDVENSRLLSIMKKYFISWSKKNFEEDIANQEQKEFLSDLKIEEKELSSLQSLNIKYGLVNNSPYEVLSGGSVGGIVTEYLKKFSKFTNIDIEYKRINNPKKFNKEVANNSFDLYMNYFTDSQSDSNINTNINLKYSIYAHESNPVVVKSLNSLTNKTVYVEENTLLSKELAKNKNILLKTYTREKDWNKITKAKNAIIAIDSVMGQYYEKHDLSKMVKVYEANTNVSYSLKSRKNETFNRLATKYFNYLDNNKLELSGKYKNKLTEKRGSIIGQIAEYSLYFILLIGLILVLIYTNSKKVRLAKKIKKDDKLKYVDQLTSLKNRNYLNENIQAWDKNTIYPQAVIAIDLNKLQEINDTMGYEEGDKQIQSAANILIKTQLDNSDIIRTNGKEFMIYLIGYNQKQITSYINKLSKELKKLPYEKGACISYSMILDDLKNIEDALNECVEEIKEQKEEQREEK